MSESRSLRGANIPASFRRFLQVPEAGADGIYRNVCDGEGDVLPLRISTAGVEVTTPPGTPNGIANRAWVEARTSLLVTDFGAVGDGVTNDSAAFQAAINWSRVNARPVYVPPAPVSWRIGTALTDTGGTTILGMGRPRLNLVPNANVITWSGQGSIWQGLDFDGPHNSSSAQFQITATARHNTLRDFVYRNGNSFLSCFGDYNRIERIRLEECRGTFVRLNGTAHDNVISDFWLRNVITGVAMDTSLAVGRGVGPYDNLARDGRKWCDPATLTTFLATQTGGTLLGKRIFDPVTSEEIITLGGDIAYTTAEAYRNKIERMWCRHTRDAIMTINGDRNEIVDLDGEHAVGSGLTIAGDDNQARGVRIRNARRGIYVIAAFGGFGRNNRIAQAELVDCRLAGVRVGEEIYREWVSGASYTGSTGNPSVARYIASRDDSAGVWRIYTDSVGQSTFGTIRPVHETGLTGDGGLRANGTASQWQFISKAASLFPQDNTFVQVRSYNNGKLTVPGSNDGGITDAARVNQENWFCRDGARAFRYGCQPDGDGQIESSTAANGVLLSRTPLIGRVTGAVWQVLTTDQAAAGAGNQMTIAANERGTVRGIVQLGDHASQASRSWSVDFAFRRGGSGAPSLVGTATVTQIATSGDGFLSGHDVDVQIDATNNAVQVRVLGVASRTASASFNYVASVISPLPDLSLGSDGDPDDDAEVPPTP
jgi:hypothetical protein